MEGRGRIGAAKKPILDPGQLGDYGQLYALWAIAWAQWPAEPAC